MAEERGLNLRFVAIGCNKVPNCLSWGANGTVAYGGGNFVVLYEPKELRVTHTLLGHTGKVKAVHWLPNIKQGTLLMHETAEDELLSGSVDHSVIHWQKSSASEWKIAQKIDAHTESISHINSFTNALNGERLIVSSAADGNVCVFKRENESSPFALFDTIKFGAKIMECAAIAALPPHMSASPEAQHLTTYLLACGGVDHFIHLFVSSGNAKFTKVAQLQGHNDWIRSLNFVNADDGSLLLASSGDNYTRIWKVDAYTEEAIEQQAIGIQQRPTLFPVTVSNSSHGSEIPSTASDTTTTTTSSQAVVLQYGVSIQALLVGHEDWVYSSRWQRPSLNKETGKLHQPMCIVTASMDRTMMLWRPDARSGGVWTNDLRVGESGGTTLGLYGAEMSTDGRTLLAHGFHGAFHLWHDERGDNQWKPLVTVSGHFNAVEDLAWDPHGNYFASVSGDQTTRVFAEWNRPLTGTQQQTTWHEVARAQVHGYDLNCIDFVQNMEHRIVTGADEKVIRVFDGPQTFIDSLHNITGASTSAETRESRPVGASVPSLGLTNKAVRADAEKETADEREGIAAEFRPTILSEPPLEEALVQNTLWAESGKLYGHGYELSALACSRDGRILASASQSTSLQHAAIRIWHTKAWHENTICEQAHKLSVTQMEWSHNDRYLLSVSRDRSWALWRREETGLKLSLMAREESHERIIWGCAWSPDDSLFATCARDKKVMIWAFDGAKVTPKVTLPTFPSAVTAVAWANTTPHLLAVGLETGEISLWRSENGEEWAQVAFCHKESHCGTVRRLRWRPTRSLDLASCSSDQSVRLFTANPAELNVLCRGYEMFVRDTLADITPGRLEHSVPSSLRRISRADGFSM